MARRLESLGGTAMLVLAVLTIGVFAVGIHNLAGAVIMFIMLLGAIGVFIAAHRQSQSASARSARRWLALLWASAALLLLENWVGLVGFGLYMLPLTLAALVTAFLGIAVQLRFMFRAQHS